MPDREAFIAAIAANPADDLPRLVFADWLDEHGEPERAEFIRAQVEASSCRDHLRIQALCRVAADLYVAHGPRWYTPFLEALGVDVKQVRPLPVHPSWPECARFIRLRDTGELGTPFADHFGFRRGFVDTLVVNAAFPPPGCSFAEAFRYEPIHMLHVSMGDGRDAHLWPKLTEPALRRITRLITQVHAEAGVRSRAALLPMIDDPHLAGVRWFQFGTSAGSGPGVIHPDAVQEFAKSPLAYRLDDLFLGPVDDDGVRALCRDSRLQVSDLCLSGSFTRITPALLARAGHQHTVRRLSLFSHELRDAGIADLARGSWHKLTELTLFSCGITDAGLHALAAAEFTPHLEVLNLNDNSLDDGSGNLDGLQELAAALNPGCLRLLSLSNTGLPGVPDFLATRFGDRVTAGW